MLGGAKLTGSKSNTLGPRAYSARLDVCSQSSSFPWATGGGDSELELCSCLVPDFAWGVERKENE